MSYVTRKGYFKEYEEAKKEHGRAVYEGKIIENLWLAAPEPPERTASPEREAVRDSVKKIIENIIICVGVAGKMFVLYKNLLSENSRSKWSTIVANQIRANPWIDLGGMVHTLSQIPSVQSFEDCVTFHFLTVFPQDAAEQ